MLAHWTPVLLDIAQVRSALTIVFVALCLLIIVFVLFRQTDSSGLSAAFGGGGGGGGGEGAFGAKSHKVVDKVIGWMCGFFVVLALLIAFVSSEQTSLGSPDDIPADTPSEPSE